METTRATGARHGRARKVIDFDREPSKVVDEEAMYVFRGRLWRPIRAGCLLCLDTTDWHRQTIQAIEDSTIAWCLTHGEVEVVQFALKRRFVIALGSERRSGLRARSFFVFVPKSCSQGERAELIRTLLDETERLELERDPGTLSDPSDR